MDNDEQRTTGGVGHTSQGERLSENSSLTSATLRFLQRETIDGIPVWIALLLVAIPVLIIKLLYNPYA